MNKSSSPESRPAEIIYSGGSDWVDGGLSTGIRIVVQTANYFLVPVSFSTKIPCPILEYFFFRSASNASLDFPIFHDHLSMIVGNQQII
jgi:hypothetical protein